VYEDYIHNILYTHASMRAYVRGLSYHSYALKREAITLGTTLDLMMAEHCPSRSHEHAVEVLARRLMAVTTASRKKGKWTLAKEYESRLCATDALIPSECLTNALKSHNLHAKAGKVKADDDDEEL
jgi:hypothetical protein